MSSFESEPVFMKPFDRCNRHRGAQRAAPTPEIRDHRGVDQRIVANLDGCAAAILELGLAEADVHRTADCITTIKSALRPGQRPSKRSISNSGTLVASRGIATPLKLNETEGSTFAKSRLEPAAQEHLRRIALLMEARAGHQLLRRSEAVTPAEAKTFAADGSNGSRGLCRFSHAFAL